MSSTERKSHRLQTRTPLEVIHRFKDSFFTFAAIYIASSVILAATVLLAKHIISPGTALISCLIFFLVFGLSILPGIHETARMLNEKRRMIIPPSLLVGLQCILNLSITSMIIPMFLLSKCRNIEQRQPRQIQKFPPDHVQPV